MKKKHTVLKIILGVFALAIRYGGFRIWKMYSDHKKYMGHGFDYMHGYSTTDFTGYHVYDGQKLVTLDHRASLIIENEEDMPVLDGAEACYPVYSALAKAVYKDIGSIEGKYHDEAEKAWNSKDGIKSVDYVVRNTYFYNGRIVTFSNTVEGYDRLLSGDVDIVLAARPSRNQKEKAMHQLEQIMTIPVGKEAFIFFVEEDNPVDNLTSEQIRGIYHGDITNWKQLGGKNQKIIAFQRPEDSGSQVMMKWFMGDVSLKEPKKVEYVGGMGDLLSKVAEYNNERGAMGYTFRYFLTGLNQETHVKILSVDGVEPTMENIKNGSYPATVDLVCAYLASNDKESVRQMINFMLSDDGQYIIEQTGYRGLPDRNVTARAENEVEQVEPDEYVSQDGRWTLNRYYSSLDEFVVLEFKGRKTRVKGNLWYYGIEEDKNWPYQFERFGSYMIIGMNYDDEKDRYTVGKADGEITMELPPEGTVFVRKNN